MQVALFAAGSGARRQLEDDFMADLAAAWGWPGRGRGRVKVHRLDAGSVLPLFR